GSDPRHVEIIPTRSSRESFESLAAIGGAIHRSLRDVENVGIPGIDKDATEIFIPNHPWIFGGLLPGCTCVIGAEESLIHDGVETASTRVRSDRDAKPSSRLVRQTGAGKRSPGRTAIAGLHDVGSSFLGGITEAGCGMIERSVQRVGIAWIRA